MTAHTLNFPLDSDHRAELIWQRIAEQACAWMSGQGLAPRDCIVLLPFSQHLPLARRAWMSQPGWPPRLETTRTLALSIGPEDLARAGEISFDLATDQLSAAALLQGQSWIGAWRRRDPQSFQLAVTRLVEGAHGFARSAAQRAPVARPAFWSQARQLLALGGPGEIERALARVALEWAATSASSPVTDALFALQPAGLVVVQAGGADPLCAALIESLGRDGCQTLLLNTDLSLDQAFASHPPLGQIELALCHDFEDEAQCSAAAVLAHVNRGQVPVALIAQDRMLLRRVRALLDRTGVALADETGWTLATLPAAAQVMALLRAAQPGAGVDAWLDWLKSDFAQALIGSERSVPQLEAKCRSRAWSRVDAVQPGKLDPDAARLWQRAHDVLTPLQSSGRRSLSEWLACLSDTLTQMQAWAALQAAPAGQQVIEALSLHQPAWPGSAQHAVQQSSHLNLAEFIAWVDQCLEAQQFVPQADAKVPQVHITPLARAIARPFGAIVLPGADAQTLGAVGGSASLVGEAIAQTLSLPTLAGRREAQVSAFAQLLRAPALTLLRRRSDGAEPLAASPLLERLQQALQSAGHAPLQAWRDARVSIAIESRPTSRAAALAQGRLPSGLSASAIDSLRTCPYQFFGRVILGLRESDELEAELEKRDYGTWLHGVLHDFHRWRGEQPGTAETELMQRAAKAQTHKLGLDAAAFLPFSCTFERFVPRYLEWLRGHEAGGAMWAEGEMEREIRPAVWQGGPLANVCLRGRLDRIDLESSDQGLALLLVDYKTGGVKGLKDKVAAPLEDTQLAVYAALMDAQGLPGLDTDRPMRAIYLALDDARRIESVEHDDPLGSAQVLLEGVGQDLLSMHGGQVLPALGEGQACEFCEMRGLCRRDDWRLTPDSREAGA